MRWIRTTRASTVLAFLAGLLIATGGTAMASRLITGRDIKNGSITAADLSTALRGQLARTGAAGAAGPVGPAGPAGPAGARGISGQDGATGPKGDPGPLIPLEASKALSGGGSCGPLVPACDLWIDATLSTQAGWTRARYYKDPWGIVHLEGLACRAQVGGVVGIGACKDATGLAGSTMFVLPAGYRPAASRAFAVVASGGTGRVDVAAGGQVIYESGGTSYVSLDGISFRAG